MNTEHTSLTAEELARLFGFALDELALNRAGRLSARQRQTLAYRCAGYLVRGIGAITLMIILAAYSAQFVDRAWGWLLYGILCALILILAIFWGRAVYDITIQPTIHMLTGTLRRAGDANHPLTLAGDVPLRVSFRRWKRLAEAYPGEYRFYIGPEHMLLSIEPLPEENR